MINLLLIGAGATLFGVIAAAILLNIAMGCGADGYCTWCQRRSKISPPGRSKTSPLNVMRYAVLGGCPGSP